MTTRFTFRTAADALRFYDAVITDKYGLYYRAARLDNAVAVVCTTPEAVTRCQEVFGPVARILGGSAVIVAAAMTV